MDWLHQLLWFKGHFLGVTWGWWKVIGFLGNAVFFSRFIVQWYATEKHKRVMMPTAFWWLSLIGSLLLLGYALFYQHDSVMILAYAANWVPYIRNLVIHKRHADAHLACPACRADCPPKSKFCFACGTRLEPLPGSSTNPARHGAAK